jgi:hypothetical protein
MIGDLISTSAPLRTAGRSAQPGRAATRSGRNFLPHHDPNTSSGARRRISSILARMRSGQRLLAQLREEVIAAGNAHQFADPRDPHSSK